MWHITYLLGFFPPFLSLLLPRSAISRGCFHSTCSVLPLLSDRFSQAVHVSFSFTGLCVFLDSLVCLGCLKTEPWSIWNSVKHMSPGRLPASELNPLHRESMSRGCDTDTPALIGLHAAVGRANADLLRAFLRSNIEFYGATSLSHSCFVSQ